MALQELDKVIGHYSGLSLKVLQYSQLMKQLVDKAKQPGFSARDWEVLSTLIATDRFERVGNFKEVMNWQEYLAFLTGWAANSAWDCSFKRVTEQGNVVFLELEERSRVGDFESVVNSVSVYEFNSDGLIEHIDIYLQMAMPSPEMLASYANVKITE